MAPEGHLSYSAGLYMRARRAQLCSVRGHIDPIPPMGLPLLPTCHRQRSASDKPTVSLDVISLMKDSYGYYREQIEQCAAHECAVHVATQRGGAQRPQH